MTDRTMVKEVEKLGLTKPEILTRIDSSSSYIGGLHQNGDDPLWRELLSSVLPVDFRSGS